MLFSIAAAADALEDLLDHERTLILSGRIDGLLRLTGEKERLLSRLTGQDGTAEPMQRLRRKAERNQQLLAAAARGIRSAARRIDSLAATEAGLRTYGRNGRAAELSQLRGGIDKQA